MAVLEQIRKRSKLLIGAIGLSLFLFIVGDLVSGGNIFSSRNVGEVNGVGVSTQDFLNQSGNIKNQNEQMSIGDIYNQVWARKVRKILMEEHLDDANLTIGRDQLIQTIKTIPDFAQNPQFMNEQGVFDLAKFNVFLNQMKTNQDQWRAWLKTEEELKQYTKEQIYFDLIKGASYTTNIEAKYAYKRENDKVDFEYVSIPYSSINNDEAKVTDKEILDYIKNNAKDFRTSSNRVVEYLFIANTPSEEDKKQVEAELNKLISGSDNTENFTTTNNPVKFINENSDTAFDSTYYSKAELPQQYQDMLFNLAVGQISSPYIDGDAYKVSKMMSKKNVTDDVTASHILVSYKDVQGIKTDLTKEQAKTKAEELLAKAKANPETFATLATENTDDIGSKSNGGKYENIRKGQMVKEFENFIFNNPVGKIGLVETQFGFHIIKVDAITLKDAVQIATLSKNIVTSDSTQNELYSKATKFEEAAQNKDFGKAATELGLVSNPEVTIDAFAENLPAVTGNQSSAISWAYGKDTNIGDIKRFESNDGTLIIKVKEINDNGLASVSQVKSIVEPILMNEKKALIIRKKMNGKTLEEIAKNAGGAIASIDNASGTYNSVAIGNEPKVVGTAFNTKENTVSKLIDGKNGVFAVRTKAIKKAPEMQDYSMYKNNVLTNAKYSVPNEVYQAIYKSADIEDNRANILR